MFSKFKALAMVIMGVLIAFSATDLKAQDSQPEKIDTSSELVYKLTLQHTTIVVSDITKSRKFYTEILKLKDLNANWLPKNQMFLSLGNNLELHVGEVPGVEIKPSNFNHFALSVNDLDSFLEYLKENGVVYSTLGGAQDYVVQKRPDGVRQTFIQDPDGYWVEINDAN